MSANPNLVALLAAIGTNTLTPGMQGALTQALALIIPNFPTPDELASALPPPDEDDAREWIAALYAIQATGGGTIVPSVNAAYTPNTESSFGPITPGGSPVDLAVADITPTGSGLLSIKATVAIASSVPDAINLALFALAPLTAITGGTPVGVGITEDPTSTTPTPSGTPIMSDVGVESTVGGNVASVTITGTYQAVPGQRTGLLLQGLSAVGGATTWVVGFTFEVVELAAGAVGSGTVASVAALANSGIAITGTPTANPIVGFSPGFGPPPLIFANVAAMAAYNAAAPNALADGQIAIVESNESVWSLKGTSAIAVGSTAQNATGAAGAQWLRWGQLANPKWLLQTAWFVDPQNVSTTASDENSGLDAAHALLTKAEVFRRWGYTWTPNLNGVGVTITYLSADAASGDTAFWAPNFENGATLTHLVAASAAPNTFTGTLLAVTAKNLTAVPANGLRSTFTTTTGAIAIGQILTNTTRANSQARVVASLGAGVFELSQPLQAWTPGAFPATNVDTWANGDAIVGTTPLKLDIAKVGGLVGSYNGVTFTAHTAVGIEFFEPTGDGGMLQLDGQCNFVLVNCSWSTRAPTMRGGSSVASQFWNCISDAVASLQPDISEAIWSSGAFRSSTDIENLGFSNNPHFGGSGTPLMRFINSDDLPTFVIMLAGAKVRLETHLQILAGGGFAGALTTTVDSVGGAVVYNDTAAHVLNVATLQIQGIATAYSAKTTAGATAVGTLAVSAANLDAAAGIGTGAGGMLFNPAGGGYLRQGVTP